MDKAETELSPRVGPGLPIGALLRRASLAFARVENDDIRDASPDMLDAPTPA